MQKKYFLIAKNKCKVYKSIVLLLLKCFIKYINLCITEVFNKIKNIVFLVLKWAVFWWNNKWHFISVHTGTRDHYNCQQCDQSTEHKTQLKLDEYFSAEYWVYGRFSHRLILDAVLTHKVPHFKVSAYYIFKPLAVIQRNNPVYSSPANGTFLRFGKDPIALLTGTHVTTL